MTLTLPPAEIGKFISAKKALEYVKPDMKLGLGTGSTAAWLVKLLAHEQNENGLKFDACATSSATTELAESLGIKIHALDDLGQMDLAIDGADEFDPELNLIKGGGGALLQEKIVETAADQLVIITDASKQVDTLGAFDLPVEVIQFGAETTKRLIGDVLKNADVDGRQLEWRGGADRLITDEKHFILDLQLKRIGDAHKLASDLSKIAGVVETGLFLDMTTAIVMGDANGLARVQNKGDVVWQETQYDLGEETPLINAVMG